MRRAHERERVVGIAWYASDADGTGGRLRDRPEDFRVREIETVDPAPVDADPGDYPYLLVRARLRGWDTNDFVGRLSNALGMSRERVSWAGTKDKRAITTQLFALRGVGPGDVADLPAVRDADVEVVGRFGRALAFGDLAGNDFEVCVRDPGRPENATGVTADLRAFAAGDAPGVREGRDEADGGGADGPGTGGGVTEGGGDDGASAVTVAVPNYFGHQRFGSRRPVTHEVGLRILRDDWRGAVRAYCGNPADAEPADTRESRRFVDEQFERATPDWRAAADRLPARLGHERAMLSRLAEADEADPSPATCRAALSAVPSNLRRLFVNAAQSYVFNRVVSERLSRGTSLVRPVPGDVVCFPDRSAPGDLAVPDVDRSQRVDSGNLDAVARHCARGRAFVTAPLVGTETTLGAGRPDDLVRAVLDDLDLAPADFDLPGSFASRGTRRPVLVRTAVTVRRTPLTFAFALPHGAYATVLLREYLKVDPLDL
ncbi:MAG: tRNA pseudouridine(13) synthase TruD [Haloferacaceae archaeon]